MRFTLHQARTQRQLPRQNRFLGFAITLLTLAVIGWLCYELILVPASTGESPSARGTLHDSPALNLVVQAEPQGVRYQKMRRAMVSEQLKSRGVNDQKVLDAMGRVPRELFVPERLRESAYADRPLPIGHGQTISQPLIVAMMTQLSRPTPSAKALDVGTGSGYQAAILAELVDEVYSIEILKPLADEARNRLQSLGYKNVEVRHGDGYRGWPEQAPFDLIIAAAAPDHVPEPLVEQLKPGGQLVLPVGGRFFQRLVVIEKQIDGTTVRRNIEAVAFVPMTGEAESKTDR